MKNSRTKNTFLNAVGGLSVKIFSILTGFVTRTIFIRTLGIEYAGVSTVFSDVLTVLSLAELGIGTSISYALYKPIAENDENQICRLMNSYRKIYTTIAFVIFSIGICIIPFLNTIIRNAPDVKEDLRIIYILYLSNTSVSYLLIYKSVFLSAAQKDYLVSKYKIIINIARTLIECLILILLHHFIAYLVTSIIFSFFQNLIIARMAEKEFPVLKIRRKEKLEEEEKRKLIQNTRAIALYKVSGTVLNGTDSILTSSILGTINAGILGNYNMITVQVYSFIMSVFNATYASIGNLAATSDEGYQYHIFKRMLFISFWIYCFSTTSLWVLLNPFMHIWQGKQYLFSDFVVCLMVIEFYIKGMLSPITQFRTSNGLFVQGKYRPLIMAIMNIVISIVMAKKIGIAGIILGTVISRAATQLWYDPWLIYKRVFQDSVFNYFKTYIIYAGITAFCCWICSTVLNVICPTIGIPKILVGLALCIVIPNTIIICAFHKSVCFKETVLMMKQLLRGRSL